MNVTFFVLTYDDRKRIEKMHLKGARVAEIADAIGCNSCLVYRELRRGFTGKLDKNYRKGYSAEIGQRKYEENCKENGFLINHT